MTETQNFKNKPYVQFVRGYPFPDHFWYKKKNFEDAMDYNPQPGDIIVASYPKTGCTMLKYIIAQIMSKGELFLSVEDMKKVFASLVRSGVEVIDSLKPPRMYRHHLPYNLVQKNDKTKVLYIYRRPEDTLVSYYHISRNVTGVDLDFDHFFEDFLSGNIGYGCYFEHILSYLSQKDDKNLLMVSYEKLLANKKEEIFRIAKFLDEDCFNAINANESILNTIIEQTSFDYMKSNLTVTIPEIVSGDKEKEEKLKEIDFFRKGIVGDGKNVLSSEQLKRVKDAAISVLKGTEVLSEWMKE